ncbi:MAG: hypothetical protein ACREMP_08360 [Candidatus Tyrphobacter sp.]
MMNQRPALTASQAAGFFCGESLLVESLFAASLFAESLFAASLFAESLFGASLFAESLVAESLFASAFAASPAGSLFVSPPGLLFRESVT